MLYSVQRETVVSQFYIPAKLGQYSRWDDLPQHVPFAPKLFSTIMRIRYDGSMAGMV